MDKILNVQKLFAKILNYVLTQKTCSSDFNTNIYVQKLRMSAQERSRHQNKYLDGYNSTVTYFHAFYANNSNPAAVDYSTKLDELFKVAISNPPNCYKALGTSWCLCDLYAAIQTELGKDVRKDADWRCFTDELKAIETSLSFFDSHIQNRAA